MHAVTSARSGTSSTIATGAPPTAAPPPAPGRDRPAPPRLALVWRVFLVNAAILLAACGVLLLTPVTVSSPVVAQEVAAILGGLAVMLILDLLLVRRALQPLGRLARSMEDVDLLRPGLRADERADGEVATLTAAFNAMVERLEGERRGGAERSVLALEEERRRVARELHDQVGQSLTGVLLQIERATRVASDEPQEQLHEAREAARSALEEVRRIAQRLRPEVLDDLGLASALRALTQTIGRATGTHVTCRIASDLPALAPDAELVVYRVAQESLTNVARHSGARTAEVCLDPSPAGVRLTVRDDGKGVHVDDVRHAGGIRGMRERALLVDAELVVEAPAGGGTVVRLDVPCAP